MRCAQVPGAEVASSHRVVPLAGSEGLEAAKAVEEAADWEVVVGMGT